MVPSLFKGILSDEQIENTASNPFLASQAPYTVYPTAEEQIVQILRKANEQGLKVIPISGGTKLNEGDMDSKGDLLLSLKKLNGIIEHSAGDMIVTMQPGTTLQEISTQLASQQQMLPLDPYWPNQATIGGVIAANDSGPKRCRYGSARDHVIGLRVVYPDGRVIRTGGKVVKNVAGYDMNKLFIGSMGTLGVITEITMKVRPLPKSQSLVILTFQELNQVQEFIIKLLDSYLEPVAIEVLSPALHHRLQQQNGIGLALSFEDVPKAVEAQEQWVQAQLTRSVNIEILREHDAIQWWSNFAALPPHRCSVYLQDDRLDTQSDDLAQHFDVALKVGSQNMHVVRIINFAHHLGSEHGIHVEAHGGSGHGISRVYLKGNMTKLVVYMKDLRAFIKKRGGYVVIQHAPAELHCQAKVWGEQPAYQFLLAGIKQAFDPKQTLSPKRFVGGI